MLRGVTNGRNPSALKNLTTNFSLIGDACSPVTEVKNGATTEFSLASQRMPTLHPEEEPPPVAQPAKAVSLQLSWGVHGLPRRPPLELLHLSSLTGVQTGYGGTSGIVVDNVGAGLQESNIYYTYRSNSTAAVTCNGTTGVGCAVR